MNNAVWASECWHLCKVQLSFPLSINRKRDSGWCGGFIFRHLRNLFSVGPAITCCLLSSFWMAPIPVWANTSSSHRGLDSHLRTGNLRILSDTRWPLGWGKRGSKHVYVGICAPVWKPSPPFPLVSLKDTGFLTEPGAHNVYGLPSKLQEFSSLCLPKTGITGTHTWTCFAVVVALVWLFWVLFLSLFNVSSVNEAQHTFITSISPIEPSAWSSLAILMSSLKKMHAPLLVEVFLFVLFVCRWVGGAPCIVWIVTILLTLGLWIFLPIPGLPFVVSSSVQNSTVCSLSRYLFLLQLTEGFIAKIITAKDVLGFGVFFNPVFFRVLGLHLGW